MIIIVEELIFEFIMIIVFEFIIFIVFVFEFIILVVLFLLIINGDFSGNLLEGWSIINRVGIGVSVGVILQGVGNYVMEIQLSYFVSVIIVGFFVF